VALSTEGQEDILQRVVSVEHLRVSDFCVVKHREERWHDYPAIKNDIAQIFGLAVPDLEKPIIHKDRG